MSKYPKYFLGETAEAAEKVHNEFVGILNNIAKDYSIHTGLDKGDLFNEALFGLAIAVKKFDKNRSDNFKAFAIFKIKDYLNQYVREFSNTVSVPKYVSSAMSIINRINNKIEMYNIECDINAIIQPGFSDFGHLNESEYEDIITDVNILKNVAERASITIDKLLKRVEFVPALEVDVDFDQQCNNTTCSTIELAEVLSCLDHEEAMIVIGLTNEKTKTVIAKEMGRSITWVNNKLKKIKEKLENTDED